MSDYSEFPTTPTAWQEQQLKDWQTVTPLSTEDVPPEPRRRVVDLTALVPGVLCIALAIVLMAGVDLSRLDQSFSGDQVSTRIEHGFGDLMIVVPRSADVRLDIEHGLGDVQVFDRGSETDGFFPGEGSRSWTDDGEPEFVLTINSGVGDVEVSRG